MVAVGRKTAKWRYFTCKILPPQSLFHPESPVKSNNKLIFASRRTCAAESSNLKCTQDEEARALIGTWVIDEVLKAIETGYTVLDTYEIWRHNIEQYDPIEKYGVFYGNDEQIYKKQATSQWVVKTVCASSKKIYT